MNRTATALIALVAIFAMSAGVFAQSFEDRIKNVRKQRLSDKQSVTTRNERAAELSIRTRMSSLIKDVQIEELAASDAIKWWSETTGVPIVIDWNSLELEGVDPNAPVNIKMKYIPASQMLALVLKQAGPDVETLYEVTPWYVQVMTKEQANAKTVVKIYDISDLLISVPDFKGPEFDLQNALDSGTRGNGSGSGSGNSRGGRGGGRGGGGGGLFGDDDDDDDEKEPVKSRAEKSEDIVTLIRETIEPEIWQFHGGEHASIKQYDGKLIVNAPEYVHRQIGTPIRSTKSPAATKRIRASSGVRNPGKAGAKNKNVSGITGN